MRTESLPVRTELLRLPPYGAPQPAADVRLNTNENPYPPPPELLAELVTAVRDAAGQANRYPDRDATELRAALADYLGHGLTSANVWAANGSNEVLQQLFQLFGGAGRTALGFDPGYEMHRRIALATGTGWATGHRAADFVLEAEEVRAQIRRHRPDICVLCSPNNPTGGLLAFEALAAALAEAPGVIVLDEAYLEFAPDASSALDLLADHPRLVITRTMSKAFAFAGARLGYLAAAPEVIEAVQLVRLPYHLSSLTQAAARVALHHRDSVALSVRALVAERERLRGELTARGLPVAPSDANFLLVGGLGDERAVWRGLLARGVLVRDVGIPGCLRVTAGTPPEGDRFLAALWEVLGG